MLDYSGMEALTAPEKIGFMFKQGSLGIDKIMSKLKFSIHTVDYHTVKNHVVRSNINFLKNAGFPITTPAHFNPKDLTWEEYTTNVLNGVLLASHMGEEANRYYGWLKTIASSGKIPHLFKYSITDFDRLVSDSTIFVSGLIKNTSNKSNLGDVYGNFNELFASVNKFNLNVKGLKSRDIEVLSKQFDMIYDIGEILRLRINNNDIVLTGEGLDFVGKTLNDIVSALNITGVMVGLINELTAVYKTQCEEIVKMK